MCFCKRFCDVKKDCTMCSRTYLKSEVVYNHLVHHHINNVYVSNLKLSPEMSNFFWINNFFKSKNALSRLRQSLGTESPLKMMKNAFYFVSKSLFVLKIFKFLS